MNTYRLRKAIREFIITVCEVGMAFISAFCASKVDTSIGYMFYGLALLFSASSIYEFCLFINDINQI